MNQRTVLLTDIATVKGKGFVWERPLRKSDLNELGDTAPAGAVLGVRTADLEMKDAYLALRRLSRRARAA